MSSSPQLTNITDAPIMTLPIFGSSSTAVENQTIDDEQNLIEEEEEEEEDFTPGDLPVKLSVCIENI